MHGETIKSIRLLQKVSSLTIGSPVVTIREILLRLKNYTLRPQNILFVLYGSKN